MLSYIKLIATIFTDSNPGFVNDGKKIGDEVYLTKH